MLLLLNANDDVNDVVAPVDHVIVQTDVTELRVTDSGCMRDRNVIFCVLIACHSKKSTRLRNIYTAVREYYYCILQ